MPAKNMLASTLACPRPPRTGRTSNDTKPNRRSVMPPVFISRPAKRKKGIARSRKSLILSIEVRASSVATRGSKRSPKNQAAPPRLATPEAKPTGIPRQDEREGQRKRDAGGDHRAGPRRPSRTRSTRSPATKSSIATMAAISTPKTVLHA